MSTQKEEVLNKNEIISHKAEDFANLFNLGKDGNQFHYIINKSLYIKGEQMAPLYFKRYYAEAGDMWTTISYKFYGTIDLWWLVCKTNNIQNPLISPKEGQLLKILKENFVEKVTKLLTNT